MGIANTPDDPTVNPALHRDGLLTAGQERLPDGKLRPNTRFTLVAARAGCWTIKLADEDETYIVPNHVRAE